jgi:hypothetical protein
MLSECLIKSTRCTARANHLEDDVPRSRTREHTNTLVEELELGILWDEYGLVGDIVVSMFTIAMLFFLALCVSLFCVSSLPFTLGLPMAPGGRHRLQTRCASCYAH